MASDILIVDDEADIRELVSGILNDEGYDTRSAGDSDRALAAIEARLTLAACKAPAACAALAVVARDEVPSHGEDYR